MCLQTELLIRSSPSSYAAGWQFAAAAAAAADDDDDDEDDAGGGQR